MPNGTMPEKGGRLLTMTEKPSLDVRANRGIYVLDPSVPRLTPKRPEFPITELLETLLMNEKRVGVFNSDESWVDIGRIEDRHRAQRGS